MKTLFAIARSPKLKLAAGALLCAAAALDVFDAVAPLYHWLFEKTGQTGRGVISTL
jgi:hypothetical protein